jgi:hypothetical protein
MPAGLDERRPTSTNTMSMVRYRHHAVALDMHDAQIGRIGSQIVLCSRSLEMIWAPLHGLVLEQMAAAHGDGDEAVIGMLDDRLFALHFAMPWISQLRSTLSACATRSSLARLGLVDLPRMMS